MRRRYILVSAIILLAALIQPASPISQPKYLQKPLPKLTPGLIAYHDGLLYIHDQARGVVASIDLETGEVREVGAPKLVRELEILDGKPVLLTADGRIIIYDMAGGSSREIPTPMPASDIDVDDLLWISIPSLNVIQGLSPSTLKQVKALKVWIDYGPGKFSVRNGVLWAILRDHKTVMRYDVESGSNLTRALEARAMRIKAFKGGAIVATELDQILLLDDEVETLKTWRLKRSSYVEIILHRLEDGRIYYISPSRWVIGEIEGDEVREVNVYGRIGGAAPAPDRIWFTQPGRSRIGWVYYSRPPKILELKVEEIEPSHYRARAKISDPDGDLSAANLTISYPSQITGVPGLVKRVAMTKQEDGWWEAEFRLRPGEVVDVSAEALDEAGNEARGSSIKVRAESRTPALTTGFTASTSVQTSYLQQNLYLVASSLILLIPILLAVLFLKAGRRRRRKKRGR